MSLTSRAASALVETRGANPLLEWGNSSPPAPGSVGGSIGGLAVTTESATQLAAVYGCCGLLADSVASLPLRVLDAPPQLNTAKELTIPPLLERPYEPISLTDWLVCFVWSLALRGEFLGRVIERDRMGFPSQIMPVSPDVATVHPNAKGELEWRFAGEKIKPEDVFHVRYQSQSGNPRGINPIRAMQYPFGLAHVMDVHATTVYGNSADPRGVIEVDGQMSDTATKQMISAWVSAHQGPRKSSLPAMLTEGAKFNPISISPADQQLLEARKYSAEEICGMIFRVPLFMLGMTERSTSFGRGIEQQERNFVVGALQGYLVRAERALSECIPAGQYVNFDLRHRIRGDSVQRAQVGSLMMLCGAWCADDVRATFDMPPLAEGKGTEIYVPINTEMYKMALEALKELQNGEKSEGQEPVQIPAPSNGKGDPANVPALK